MTKMRRIAAQEVSMGSVQGIQGFQSVILLRCVLSLAKLGVTQRCEYRKRHQHRALS